ncbi:predicted protein [Chaetoceros tenuissimus]|uniref:Uncharacterized protein n=1 Tax=Chaetoceros tenuissimus TaxID=426638 RepID=A0AAD3CPM9_9STRA|nr:predicted protein [Chaetoceros tenuissimus]
MLTAVKQALKAIVYPVVGSLKVLVTRPVLSAFRHEVSDWCSVQNTEDQEGEGRRVRFALNAKKYDGVLEWSGVWTPSRILREVGGEVCHISKPFDYKDGNFGDWDQHYMEDLEKRASFWHHVSKRNSVENQWSDLERKIHSLADSERFMEERFREKQRALEQMHPELERKIDEFIYPEGNTEELLEEEEINEFAEAEAARWEDKKIEKKVGGEGAVIEDAGGAEDMDVEMLDVQDQEAARWEDKKIEKKLGGEGAVIEDAGGAEDMDVEMLDVQDEEEDADKEETDAVGAENDEKGVWIGEGEYKFKLTKLIIPAQPLSCLNRKYKSARGAFEKERLRLIMKARSAVIEDAGGPEDMKVDMLEEQDQDHSENNVEEDTHEVDNVMEHTVAEVSTSVEELKELTVHLEFSSFVQIGSKRRKLEANPEHQESDSVETEVPIQSPDVAIESEAAEEEPMQVHQESDSVETEVSIQSPEAAIEIVAAEAAEEEPMQVQTEVQQESDSVEAEELGSGFTTDATGRVRRFSHRLKGKSRRIYKF